MSVSFTVIKWSLSGIVKRRQSVTRSSKYSLIVSKTQRYGPHFHVLIAWWGIKLSSKGSMSLPLSTYFCAILYAVESFVIPAFLAATLSFTPGTLSKLPRLPNRVSIKVSFLPIVLCFHLRFPIFFFVADSPTRGIRTGNIMANYAAVCMMAISLSCTGGSMTPPSPVKNLTSKFGPSGIILGRRGYGGCRGI